VLVNTWLDKHISIAEVMHTLQIHISALYLWIYICKFSTGKNQNVYITRFTLKLDFQQDLSISTMHEFETKEVCLYVSKYWNILYLINELEFCLFNEDI